MIIVNVKLILDVLGGNVGIKNTIKSGTLQSFCLQIIV